LRQLRRLFSAGLPRVFDADSRRPGDLADARSGVTTGRLTARAGR
jgi:hypothetical protein